MIVSIFSKNFSEHLQHLGRIFKNFREANLKLKGLPNYYRKFVKNFADIASSRNELLVKGKPFVWTDACEQAFNNLKDRLVSAPILSYHDFTKEFILYTDASGFTISYILGQKDSGGRETAIAYGGRALRQAEKNWSISERDCLALGEGINVYRIDLANKKSQVHTDHSALTFVHKLNEAEANSRLARWAMFLHGYKFDIAYKKGKKHTDTDALSQRNYETEGQVTEIKVVSKQNASAQTEAVYAEFDPFSSIFEITEVSKQDLIEQQRSDADFAEIIRYIEDRTLPDRTWNVKRIINEAQDYVLDDDVFHFYYPSGKGHRFDRLVKQLAVPHQQREDILKSYHDSFLGSHQGKDRTNQTIRYKYFWPNMYSDIGTYIQTCLECQVVKQNKHKHPAPLRPMTTVFSRVHLDLTGPLKTSPEGYQHILVITCAFSKWTDPYPLKGTTAIEIAEAFFRNFIGRLGSPDSILIDRGQHLLAKVLIELCNIFDIAKLKRSGNVFVVYDIYLHM